MEMKDFSAEIDKSLDLLFKVVNQSSKKKELLNKGKNVYLQVGLFKIPPLPRPIRKFVKLQHSLYGDDPDICLFVPNKKTGVEYKKTSDEFIDYCVEYYTELLDKHKVNGINTVMPIKQLKSEYGTYELRRKLVQRFDLFLCKNSLLYNPRFTQSLGKIFRIANKDPLGISFPEEKTEYDPQFQKNIERAIHTSTFFIKPHSDNYSIPIGTLSNTKNELKENIKTVLEQILMGGYIPGGFNNIKVINIWPSQSKVIPFYICKDVPEKIQFEHESNKKKRKRNLDSRVTDELSTLPGKKVTVTKNGDVFVSNIDGEQKQVENFDFEDDESFDEGSEEEQEVAKNEKTTGKTNKNIKREEKNNEVDSDEEDDEEIEKNEERFLKKIRKSDCNTFQGAKSQKKSVQNEESHTIMSNKINNKVKKSEIKQKKKKIKLRKKDIVQK